jgi:DnaJ-class molecular chaperone
MKQDFNHKLENENVHTSSEHSLESCPSCEGSGSHRCSNCGGSGVMNPADPYSLSCSFCGGDGKINCSRCGGSGQV